jgi:hypothetical protein
MVFNLNSGYGRVIADRLASGVAGKIIVVGKSAIAHRDMYQDIFGPDAAGTVLFAATVDAAIGICTANSGDTIYVLPGHTETVTSTSIAHDVAGISVIGLGNGLNRPTFTYGAAAATITVSAANGKWENCHFIANFDNVAAAFTLGAAKDFMLKNCTFVDVSSSLHFLQIVVTGSTANAADGLQVIGNRYQGGLAVAPGAFISVLGTLDRIRVADNYVKLASTDDEGSFITLADKNITNAEITNNKHIVVGSTGATVGIFLTGSGTACTGIVDRNFVTSLDTTTELIATAGTGLAFFENYYTGTADASGKLWPAVDGA